MIIIGCGKLGSSLYRALSGASRFRPYMVSPEPYADVKSRYLPHKYYSNYVSAEMLREADIVFIAVHDQAIPLVRQNLSAYELDGKVILHTSGATPAGILSLLKDKGALTGSFHPLQTFGNKFLPPSVWQNIVCSYQGDRQAIPLVENLCEHLGSKLRIISEEQKIAIHLAASITSNFSVALIAWAERILRESDFNNDESREILYPLMRQTIENYHRHPATDVLTGPLQRGDIETVRHHLQYLANHPDSAVALRLYLTLSEFILSNPDFDIRHRDKLLELIESYEK